MKMPALDTFDEWTPEEIPTGFVANAGTADQYVTGGWRSMRPVWFKDNCVSCMMCFLACPDSSIEVEDGKMVGIDYDHCKGCGVCVHECRFKALDFIREEEVVHEEEEEIASVIEKAKEA